MKLFKDRFEPCCGFSFQWSARVMAVLDTLMLFTGCGYLVFDVIQLWPKWQRERIENILHFYVRLGIWCGYVGHVLLSYALNHTLFKCGTTKNLDHLCACFFVSMFNTTFGAFVYYFHTFYFGLHLHTLAIYNGYLLFKCYAIFAMNYFHKVIKDELNFDSSKRFLTDYELKEFEEGLYPPPFDIETKSLMEKVNYARFKKEEFEVPLDQLRFDMTNPLGQGAFGCVYKAQLERNDGYETTVAVKMINPDEADVTYFKALLMEVKIMSCIGRHQNIVQLIGATTKQIRERKLLLVIEFCAFGSLSDHLRGNRGLFKNLVRGGEICPPNTGYDASPFSEEDVVSTEDLINWSCQIACGMQYLESKKVVHGDCAARNVLLTSKKVAKITDFGLARQLYAYSVYVRKQNTPLPWRYLSPEALADMAFSTASDIWSYGITLTEVFSLAEIPWQGYDFSLMFVENLKKGLQPNMPPYATNFLYQEIMKKCWNLDPESRPSFTEIIDAINDRYKSIIFKFE